MLQRCQRLLVLGLACAGLLAVGAPAEATVPPSDCGSMTVKGKRYNVRADQLRCTTGRSHTRGYLSSHTRPSGYSCKDYGPQTKLKFRCAKGTHVFFAVRR